LAKQSELVASHNINLPVNPKVTIGVCVRNCQETISMAINSIMAQNFPHELMEVIFVDDGSEDETLSIIREYASKMDMRVKIFHHKWRGLGYSRNVVVQNASGEYIIWVDGDMILPKDHVQLQVKFMDENPKVGIGKAKYAIFSKENVVALLEDVPFIILGLQNYPQALKLAGTGGSIYRTNAVRQVGSFDDRLTGVGEDIDVAYRIMLNNWAIERSPASFFELRENSWRDLWKKYVWYGYGNFWVYRKNKEIFKLYKMIPPASLIAGLLYSFPAYKLTGKKIVFLLPVHFIFKSVAWSYGFIKAYFRCNSIKNRLLGNKNEAPKSK